MQNKCLFVGIFDDCAKIAFLCKKKAKYNHHSCLPGNRNFLSSLLSTLMCGAVGSPTAASFAWDAWQVGRANGTPSPTVSCMPPLHRSHHN